MQDNDFEKVPANTEATEVEEGSLIPNSEDLDYIIVDDEYSLNEVCSAIDSLTQDDFIGLDTEFMRVTCYYPDFSLLQLEINQEIYLVDVLQLESVDPVIHALCNTEAVVLLFSGTEDMELLAREARRIGSKQFLPKRIYDLQLMLAFCGHSFGRGLNFALKEMLGFTLPKDCTRSNWNRRPLSPEQLEYGALDVYYLKQLFDAIRERISDRNFSYFQQEMEYFRSHYEGDMDEDEAYLSISAAGMLTERELNILQFLAKQRVLLAKQENQALNRIITSKAMWQLAKFTPRSKTELERRGVKHITVIRYGDTILKWLNQAKRAPIYPHLTIPYDYFSHQRVMQENFECLKREVKSRIADGDICPQVLLRKQFLNDYFRAKSLGQVPLLQQSWRLDYLGPIDVPLEPIIKEEDPDGLAGLELTDPLSTSSQEACIVLLDDH